MREHNQHQRGPKIYRLHAPEVPKVERIGNGKAPQPCELDVKANVATTLRLNSPANRVRDPKMDRPSRPIHQASCLSN
jgi:hypothetical protein